MSLTWQALCLHHRLLRMSLLRCKGWQLHRLWKCARLFLAWPLHPQVSCGQRKPPQFASQIIFQEYQQFDCHMRHQQRRLSLQGFRMTQMRVHRAALAAALPSWPRAWAARPGVVRPAASWGTGKCAAAPLASSLAPQVLAVSPQLYDGHMKISTSLMLSACRRHAIQALVLAA